MKNQYMAIDQYGQTFHGLTYPRKELCEILGNKHADKMYVDKKNGDILHVGYVIAGHWLNVYKVCPFKE